VPFFLHEAFMNPKALYSSAVVLAVLGIGLARAGDPQEVAQRSGVPAAGDPAAAQPAPGPMLDRPDLGYGVPSREGMSRVQGEPQGPRTQTPASEPAPMLSSWLTYSRPDCCGPVGGNGPIDAELYVRTGPTITFGDGILAHLLNGAAGWDVQAGGRSLFFNAPQTAAWTVDLSLNYIYNHSKTDPKPMIEVAASPTSPPTAIPVTLRNLHRTFADVALGREWYLHAPADACDWRWRVGGDVGGRLGTAKAEFDEIQHRTDTIYGVVTSIHTDVEKPYGCCTMSVGFRAEWDFTWMDILQRQNDSNIQDVNLLVTFGVRF
jgi:hypothetical protein